MPIPPLYIVVVTLLNWIPQLLAHDYVLMRTKRENVWHDRPEPFAPAGFTPKGEIRSPIMMELRRDLTPANGPSGLCGVCTRVYRVLHDTSLSAQEECRRHNSRQSVLGDITEFYHTLIESRQFNRTLEFPLADLFNRFSLRASFMYLDSRRNEPAVLIEATQQSTHVLCVESIKCPETTTTPVLVTTQSAVLLSPAQQSQIAADSESNEAKPTQVKDISGVSGLESKRADSSGEPFWDALLNGTEAKSWFLATVSLSCLCFLLLILLLISWLYICRIRRLYARRRCRGTCRFGCRCPIEVVRQTVNDAAVFGPLDSQNAQLFTSPMTPQGNGSIRSGSGFGAALYSGGTMTSSRWGSNGGTKLGSPIYVSLASAPEKTSLMAPTTNCLVGPVRTMTIGPGGLDTSNGGSTWGQPNNPRLPAHSNRRRLSQDVICRSTSDGSTVSGHPVSNTCSKVIGTSHPRSGLVIGHGYIGSCSNTNNNNCISSSTAVQPVLINNVNNGQLDSVGYYQPPPTVYNYSDMAGGGGGRTGGISPSMTQSPTQLTNRKSSDRVYYGQSLNLSAGSPGPVVEEDEVEHTSSFFPLDQFHGTSENHQLAGTCSTFNSYASDPVQRTNPYPLRESEGDLLNITPPSGFYEPNSTSGDSGMVNGGLTSSSIRSNSQTGPTTFSTRSFLSSVNPKLGSTMGQADWKPVPMTSVSGQSSGEMVGMVDMESVSRLPMTNNGADQFQKKTASLTDNNNLSTGLIQNQNQVPPHRIYTAYERML
ncbi:hypothetical protein T265_08912 [Opisthorchis viverrini]|uniref:Uncharacterized protein n=1 Tax=Opisthorchis viverrini TaxID=6198 RepID=A0A075A6T9_OPIVI|nr:hypothetical protein T265_08912 [Opisthorchis viverrini]KER23144.1 hypothetical protein T265_08912 [Opisthorchis viverrini]